MGCSLGLIKGGEYYYTDCCGNFITGNVSNGDTLEVSFNNLVASGGVGDLNTPVVTSCVTQTQTPTTTTTPTNTPTPSITPTHTLTSTPTPTPSITPSNRPVTRLQNSCDVITLFEMGVSCNVIQSPTDSNPLGGILSLNVTGGTAPYSYYWNGGSKTQTLFGVPAGSYPVTVIDYYGDYTVSTICKIVGPLPSPSPTTTPTPTPTSPVKCVDLCLIGIGSTFETKNFGPIQFICNGTKNGRFKWSSEEYDIVWNISNNRWEIYNGGTNTLFTVNGGILASTSFSEIPDSAWSVFGGTSQYLVTMTKGQCPTVIPLQVSVNKTSSTCQLSCNGSISIIAENGTQPYTYSIDGGITYGTNNNFSNLCPNTYSVVVNDSNNNQQTSSVTIAYDSLPITYQLSLSNALPATPITVSNVSQTVTQVMNLMVTPPLPVGVTVTFDLLSTALLTVNGPGTGNSNVIWTITKNNQPVTTTVGPTTQISNGQRPNCSPDSIQNISSINYSSTITITNGDVIQITSTTVDNITNGQVATQTNCTTNIITKISASINNTSLVGNKCGLALGGSTQVQTNNFTYVPNSIPEICDFNIGSGFDNQINSISTQLSNDRILVGGRFYTYKGVFPNNLICLDKCGNVDITFNEGNVGFSNYSTYTIFDINVMNSGSILVSGLFQMYNDVPTPYFLKLNPNGTLDTTFNLGGSGFDYWTDKSLVQSDGKIVVTGNFSNYNGVSANKIIRLNSNGSRDNTFNIGTGFNFAADSSVLQSDGKIVAVGRFTLYNGTPCNNIVRLLSNGSIDTSFNIGSGFSLTEMNRAPGIIRQDSNGKLLIGGEFNSYNGTSSKNLIRLNLDGTVDTSFSVGLGFDDYVGSFYIQTNGSIIVVGSFTTYNSTITKHIIRLTNNGSVDTSFIYGSGLVTTFGPQISIGSTVVQNSLGEIFVGGYFNKYNSVSYNNFVKLLSNGTSNTIT
jgi:uncharacterized delta-60 repeat protein